MQNKTKNRNEQIISALDEVQKSQERRHIVDKFGRYNIVTAQIMRAQRWWSNRCWVITTSLIRKIYKLLGYRELLCKMTQCDLCGSRNAMWRVGCHCDNAATVKHGWLTDSQQFLSIKEQKESGKVYFQWVDNYHFEIIKPNHSRTTR